MKRVYAAFVFLLLLSGCASLGIAPAQSLKQRIAYGYSTYSAVNYAATNGVTKGTLEPTDGDKVLKLTDEAKGFLDGAKALVDTNPQGATDRLTLAISVLQAAQSFIDSKAKS